MGSKAGQKYKTKFISHENVKDFLIENNVSLEKLGDEEKQNEFIENLTKALLELKRARNFKSNSRDEKNEKILIAYTNLGEILGTIKIPSNVLDNLSKTFIPSLEPSQEQKEDIDALKKQIEELETEKTKLEAENRVLKEKLKEKEQEQSQALDDEEIITEESIESGKPVQPKTPKRESEKSDAIDIEGKVVDKRDEKASEIFKDILDYQKELRKQKKDAKKSQDISTALKKDKDSIGEGVKKILSSSYDLMRVSVIHGDLLHDVVASPIFAAGVLTVTTGYVAGRVTGKVVKGVAKIALKTISGVATVAGIAGKLVFKGAKGVAKECKKKVDKKMEQKRIDKAQEEMDSLSEADKVTKEVLKFSKNRLEENLLREEDLLDMDLGEKQKRYLNDIRNSEKREETESVILAENSKLIKNSRSILKNSILRGISQQVQTKFGLKPKDINNFIKNVTLDENGKLVIGENSPITLQQLEQKGLTQELTNIASLSNVEDLSVEDISDITYYLKDFDLQKLEEARKKGDISQEAYEYVKTIGTSNINISTEKIENNIKTLEGNFAILQEAYSRDTLDMAVDLREQTEVMIQAYVETYAKENQTSKDFRKRDQLRKIAEAKVKNLKKAGIVEVVQDGDSKEARILKQAEHALSYDIIDNLEKTADIKRDKIDKMDNKTQEEH